MVGRSRDQEIPLNESICPFCWKIETIEELGASDVVWHFPHSVALLGMWQFYQGYCLLVSRRHAAELSELLTDERRAYLEEMCLLAQAIQTCYRPHKLNYELLGNQVPHLHWHLFPRYLDDPDRQTAVWLAIERALREDGAWRRRMETGREERAATAVNLRRTLRELGAPQA
jgi:diadenosine tetraphosphate (Ap4A) HIT family hydrolase